MIAVVVVVFVAVVATVATAADDPAWSFMVGGDAVVTFINADAVVIPDEDGRGAAVVGKTNGWSGWNSVESVSESVAGDNVTDGGVASNGVVRFSLTS